MDAPDKEVARESLKFIEQAMEVSTERGMMTMYSWNQEKFPAIARFITALINDRPFDDYDKQSAMRNLSVWRAGEVWTGLPPVTP